MSADKAARKSLHAIPHSSEWDDYQAGPDLLVSTALKSAQKLSKALFHLLPKEPKAWDHREFKRVCKWLKPMLEASTPLRTMRQFRLHPDLETFLGYPVPAELVDLLRLPAPLLPAARQRLEAGLQEYVTLLREKLSTPDHRKAVHRFMLGPKKNRASMVRYIDALFERHQKLLVLRIDLHYQERRALFPRHSPDQLLGQFRRLLNNRKNNSIFNDFVGYAAKLEFASGTGFHLHCMFIYNGSERREDIVIAQQIGEYWVQLTGEPGRYYNCNYYKHSYKKPGIGLIRYTDGKLRKNLELAIDYMTKPELYMKPPTGVGPKRGAGRVFFRGELPSKTQAKPGRVRSRVYVSPKNRQLGEYLRLSESELENLLGE
ncbi:inovirus-type Gp2 protein [Aeromonas veronii]|nr:inovirus-type Gp2 protein [Aeromonas veronii]